MKKYWLIAIVILLLIASGMLLLRSHRKNSNTNSSENVISNPSAPMTVSCPGGAIMEWGETVAGSSDLFSSVSCDNSANEKPEWSDKITITGYNNNLGKPSPAHLFDKQADIDGDGIKETLNLIDEGTNHCCSSAEVIRNNKVIFTFNDEYEINDIKPAENNNGFYIDWHTENQYAEGMCCPSGQIRTHFVMQNGKFVPIEEETINYIKLPQ